MLSGKGIVKHEYPFGGNRHYGISGGRVTSYECEYESEYILCPIRDGIRDENAITMKPVSL
jgi:hypothetical protein